MNIRSNGKLMITGEYLVLAGARALAMPVKYGQSLRVTLRDDNMATIYWKSLVKDKPWIEAEFQGAGLTVQSPKKSKHEQQSINFVRRALVAAKKHNPGFLSGNSSWEASANLEFDKDWGLGSSSSLLSNIAHWADVDPFELFFSVSQGSGYDIACARSNSPIIYTYKGKSNMPLVENVSFDPAFHRQLFFVYSGRKQDSAKSIAGFDPGNVNRNDVAGISQITDLLATTSDLNEFILLMHEHEALTAAATGMKPVQKEHFAGFGGAIKSLGAWGGDFLLAASALDESEIRSYFASKGIEVVIAFRDMALAGS